jgi:hypothetical protein
MSEQRINQAAEAATTGDADPGESGQGAARDTLGAAGGDAPVSDAERRAQDTTAGADDDTSTEGEDALRSATEKAQGKP